MSLRVRYSVICPVCWGPLVKPHYLWMRLWPFNFCFVNCQHCGPVEDEIGLWGKLFSVAFKFMWWAPAIEDGNWKFHAKRHPWWQIHV